jgi:LPXTG-motif cell wall-anchored protein
LIGTLLAVVAFVAPAAADDNSKCPPGQPSGRPPGNPPTDAGKPTGRPPQYPIGECKLKLDRGSAARGESVMVSGEGFTPGSVVALRLDPGGHVLGSATAGADGSFVTDVVIPQAASLGRNEVLASGGGRELAAGLEVTAGAAAAGDPSRGAATAPASGSLPRTGDAFLPTTLLGVSLVALGATAVMVARRRRPVA